MTTQARINAGLSESINSAFVAATISFGTGLFVLLIVLIFLRKMRQGFHRIIHDIRANKLSWWFTLAGSAGAGYVLSQAVVVGITGVALFTVAFVAGLTVGSLLLDMWGVGPAGKRPLSWNRIVGAALGLVAVGIGVSGQELGTAGLGILIMPVVFGVCVAWQQAANGRLSVSAKNPWTSTIINFAVGTGVLLIATAINAFQVGLPSELPSQWWLYLGGPVGIIFIALNALLVRTLGVLLLSLGTIAGQLTTALFYDAVTPAGHQLVISSVVGTVVIFVAVLIATLPKRFSKS